MRQPELPVDPPVETETPVDHIKMMQSLLMDIEYHVSRLDAPATTRRMFGCGVDALEKMLEVMR